MQGHVRSEKNDEALDKRMFDGAVAINDWQGDNRDQGGGGIIVDQGTVDLSNNAGRRGDNNGANGAVICVEKNYSVARTNSGPREILAPKIYDPICYVSRLQR
mmetsp:Transcript_5185/g.11759  ORF Transcript_5185/g.11759 Transcript_5185/m.11759 type:complete len:103 (+) Transcript_5185:972-1280(+)